MTKLITQAAAIDAEDLFQDVEDIDAIEAEDEANTLVKVEDSSVGVEVKSNDTPKLSPRQARLQQVKVKRRAKFTLQPPQSTKTEVDTKPKAPVRSLTELGRLLRNSGFKITIFNVKDTLIRYLELFGERKIARHVVDQDGHTFYEIHAVYIPGSTIYKFLLRCGFKALHPTDLDENYPKDMRYEVAMSNGILNLNIFGGLQQHAPTEETVIRNLYEWEKKRYGVNDTSLVSESSTVGNEVEVAKNLILAAMQSHSLDKTALAYEFFEQAMHSKGIDALINVLASQTTFEKQPTYIELSDVAAQERQAVDEINDEDRAVYLEPQTHGELFQFD